MLNKRETFRTAFDGFSVEKIAAYDDNKIAALQSNKDIIRNKLKIRAAAVNNSKNHCRIKFNMLYYTSIIIFHHTRKNLLC